jgi:Subunit CCDC53 of WASH complex
MEIHATAALDYTESPPVHYEKTVSMVNTFVISTVQFVNKFALLAEEKLDEVTKRVQSIEISLAILEAKLSSIHGLEDITAPGENGAAATQTQQQPLAGEDLPGDMPQGVGEGMPPPPPPPGGADGPPGPPPPPSSSSSGRCQPKQTSAVLD